MAHDPDPAFLCLPEAYAHGWGTIDPGTIDPAEILGTWEFDHYAYVFDDGGAGATGTVIDMHAITQVRLDDGGTGLITKTDGSRHEITWEVAEHEEPGVIYIKTSWIGLWYQTDPTNEHHRTITFSVSDGYDAVMKKTP